MPAKLKASLPYWVTLAVSAYLYHVALGISAPGTGDQLGPDFWPKACLILMMLVCVAGIAKALLLGGRVREVDHEPVMEGVPFEDQEEPAQRFPWLLGGGIALCLGYVVLFDVLGFFLDTFLFMLAFILLGRYRRMWIALASSLVGTLIFMFVFMKIVYVALPIGTPPFSAVSLLLMRLMGIR
jgi:putative tricarboxylic transport membrane protein